MILVPASRMSKQVFKKIFCIGCCSILMSVCAFTQNTIKDTTKYKTLEAGSEYKKSSWHQLLWGKNYRQEWTTPVTVPVMMLDTANGGLTPDKAGGGHQTKSLHLKTANEQAYTIRSVNKTLAKVLQM